VTTHHLLVTYDFPPLGGGIARALGEIARHYPPGSLTVSTGLVRGANLADALLPNRVDRVPVRSDRLKNLPGLLRWSRRAGRLAQRIQAGFAWGGNLRPAGHVTRWLGDRHGLAYGLLVYGMDVIRLERRARRSRLRRLAARRILEGAAGIVAISTWTARRMEALLEWLGLGAGPPVRVVPLGADPGRFRPGLDAREVRQRYGLEEGPWLLTVARLVPHKGIDTALDVLARLQERLPALRYAVAGTGPDAARLHRLAEALGVSARVRWLGQVPDRDLPALYNVAAVYLGLSREEGDEVEGFGLSLVEAMASGRPVVAAASGGIPDAVRDGVSGLLVPPADPAEAARAAARLLAEPALAAALGRGGRAEVEARLNWARVVTDLREAAATWSGAPARRAGR
jgi:phosphatidylinositol alpha-1,6-mannosyltransferase